MNKLESISIENEHIKVTVLPRFGGKISELINKKTGTQFLKSSEINYENISPPEYGDEFLPPYAFGFDECLPNIAAETIHENGKEINLPDHGEIWSRKSRYQLKEDEITLQHYGLIYNYLFQKRLSLDNNMLNIHYELKNLQPDPFNYIWSSHPLLNIDVGDKLLFNNQIEEVIINWSSDKILGRYKEQVSWPYLDRQNPKRNFSEIQNRSSRVAIKLFTTPMNVSAAGIYRHSTDESLFFSFDNNTVPHLGIWLCYGGWPEDIKTKDFTVALEPARGGLDLLSNAKKDHKAFEIKSDEVQKWEVEISIEKGKAEFHDQLV